MKRHFPFFLAIVIIATLLSSCSRDEKNDINEQEDIHYTVAVILPLDQSNAPGWQHIASQMEEKIRYAQSGLSSRIVMDLEWYDENTVDIAAISAELAERDDVKAVIGPLTSSNTKVAASALARKKKTLIPPAATSTELARIYAGKGFYWGLSETDITQCEVLLHEAQSTYHVDEISLLASTDTYGQSFIDWFGFLATEIGIKVCGIYTYDPDDSETLRDEAIKAFNETNGMVISVPSCMDDVREVAAIQRKVLSERLGREVNSIDAHYSMPYLLFSDMAFTSELLTLPADEREYLCGVAIAADPQSGFDLDYRLRFGEYPSNDLPQFHDALLLTALGLRELADGRTSDLNEALADIVRTKDDSGKPLKKIICVDADNIAKVMRGISDGTMQYDLSGASSNLDFDEELLTTVVHSTYKEWFVYNGEFITIANLSSDGSGRTEKTLAAWNLKTTYDKDYRTSLSFSYPKLDDKWALLVAASEGWENYRHQADVLKIYHMLRQKGYPDDHIILIMADDLARDRHNPNQGKVVDSDGIDLYKGIVIDYYLNEITPSDIESIMTGNSSERLREVLQPDSNDNILVFWSGHGRQGDLCWGNNNQNNSFNKEVLRSLLRKMVDQACYRKALWLVEACYSASVAIVAEEEDIPGMMMITAANANETSKAYEYNSEYSTWMTNRFTQNLIETLKENNNCLYIDLYRGLTRQTTGSHVTIINNQNFDNLQLSTIGEFFNY